MFLIWSILAYLHPCDNSHSKGVKNYIQNFKELNIKYFDFTNGFKCSDMHRFEKLINLSINMFELNLYQDGDEWKHNLIPIEITKNESDKIVDLVLYENHYAINKKLNVYLGNHNNNFICRQCLNSYTNENALMSHKEKCDSINLCTIRT